MRFDIYQRFTIEIIRSNSGWKVFRISEGRRMPEAGFAIPEDLKASSLETFLGDIYHEWATPETEIKRID